MTLALQLILKALEHFNTFAPLAGQIIATFRKPDGTEIPLLEAINGVVQKNNQGISNAETYLATHPEEN